MNDWELNDLLRQARVPERSEDYWREFSDRVMRRLRTKARELPSRRRPWTLAWGLGLAAACLVLGFALGLRKGKDSVPPTSQFAEQQKLFCEVASLFPNRLQAIVIEGSQVRLVLSETADVPASPPLVVEICRAGRCRTFITFSGQQVRVNGDAYDVLYSAEGKIIVAGRNQVWIGSQAMGGADGVKVQARLLEGKT